MTAQDKQAWYNEMIELFSNDERFPHLEKACLLILECVDDEEEWSPYHFNVLKKFVKMMQNRFEEDYPNIKGWFYKNLLIKDNKLDLNLLSKREINSFLEFKQNYKNLIKDVINFRKGMFETKSLIIDPDKLRFIHDEETKKKFEKWYFDHNYVDVIAD